MLFRSRWTKFETDFMFVLKKKKIYGHLVLTEDSFVAKYSSVILVDPIFLHDPIFKFLQEDLKDQKHVLQDFYAKSMAHYVSNRTDCKLWFSFGFRCCSKKGKYIISNLCKFTNHLNMKYFFAI